MNLTNPNIQFLLFCSTIFRGKRDSQYLIQGNGDMGNVAKSGSSGAIRNKPVDTKPISKDDLVAAYLERHRDSDYGFQVILVKKSKNIY